MDLFTGKKIAELRKFNSLSQEALAEKLGVSRQAISKWERGEATPDMDNFMALAGIFDISLDDLLGDKKAAEIMFSKPDLKPQPPVADTPQNLAIPTSATENATEKAPSETAFPDEKQKSETTAEQTVKTEENAEEKSGEPKEKERKKTAAEKAAAVIRKARKDKEDLPRYRPETADKLKKIPVFFIIPALYVVSGILLHLWHPGWISILLIPAYYMFIWACNAKSRKGFLMRLPVPFLAIALYVLTGLMFDTWHPGWLVFFCVPAYYIAVWKTK